MNTLLGLIRVRVKRGLNLAVRDVRTSDPYVVLKLGNQKLKTRVIKKNVNPEWNEDLTLYVADPNLQVKLLVYDHDSFSKDDKMGEAEFEIKPFVNAAKMDIARVPNGTTISSELPTRNNCLSEESAIVVQDGRVTQTIFLRLKNVECGEIEVELHWVDLPDSKDKGIARGRHHS